MEPETEVIVPQDDHDSKSLSAEAEAPILSSATDSAAKTAEGVYLPVYNGEVVRVQADDTQRVTGLLQKGLRFEQFSPQFDRLKTISRSLGCHKPEEAVEWMANALKQVQYEGILREVGGNEQAARELLAARTAETPAPEAPAPEVRLTDRLADEFLALAAEYPEAADWEKLPDDVLKEAAETGRSLTDCWLRYQHRELTGIRDAQNAAAAAAAASGGSLRSLPDNGVEATSRSFLAGFRSRL